MNTDFKFNTSKWNVGEIQFQSMEEQGLFINICSLLWAKEEVTEEYILKKYKNIKFNTTIYDCLKNLYDNKLIVLQDGKLYIDFIDKQKNEIKGQSNKAREKALKRWNKQPKNNTVVVPPTKKDEDNTPESVIDPIEEEIQPSLLNIENVNNNDLTLIPEEETKPIQRAKNTYNSKFEEFWAAYPKRNGIKVGKQLAYEAFKKIKEEDIDLLIQNTKNYAINNDYPKDACRFLKNDFWRDWVETMEEAKPNRPKTYEEIEREEQLRFIMIGADEVCTNTDPPLSEEEIQRTLAEWHKQAEKNGEEHRKNEEKWAELEKQGIFRPKLSSVRLSDIKTRSYE